VSALTQLILDSKGSQTSVHLNRSKVLTRPEHGALNPDGVAIMALSSGYPAASGPTAFWQAAVDGSDIPELVPVGRWDIDQVYAPQQSYGCVYVRFATFTEGIHEYDAEVGD
jgi:acyl transferase domain-containing protein